MHNQVGVDKTGLFQFVGNDTTDEVRLGGPQGGHQVVQLFLIQDKYVRRVLRLFGEVAESALV